jgi:hypothetical protein
MATKRQRIARQPERLTLGTLRFAEWFSLVVGWAPPPSPEAADTRWRTWSEFMRGYDDVRDMFLEERAQQRPGALSFAEFLWQAPRTSRGRAAAIDQYQVAKDAEAARRRSMRSRDSAYAALVMEDADVK